MMEVCDDNMIKGSEVDNVIAFVAEMLDGAELVTPIPLPTTPYTSGA